MNHLKKMISPMLFALLISVLAAGCSTGSNSAGGVTPSVTPEEKPTDKPKDTPSDKPKDTVEITFWHVWSEKDSGPIEAAVEAFNKKQDRIKVKVLGNQDATKQLTAISGGNPPDVALTFWNNIGPWADAGAVLELDDYFAKNNFDVKSVVPAAMERMKVGDKHYGVPFTMSMANTLMYNKQAFQEAGLSEPPKTLEQLLDYAGQLTKKDGSGNITNVGFMPDYPWIDNVFWPVIFGGSWVSDDGKVTPNRKENVASIEYQRKFYELYGNEALGKFKSGLGQRGTPQDPMLTGQIAMIIGWEYNFTEERTPDGPIGIAPFPYPADSPDLEGAGMVSPRGVFIPKKAKHPDEAWEFLQYLMSVDAQVEFSTESKVIPTVIKALDDERLTKNEELSTMWDFYERAKSENLQGFPNNVYINQYLQALSEETEKALNGQTTAQQAMDKVAEKIQPLADKANK
ncbi:ABC transporter substrate-binding protein [Paenibacillus sp. J2TS4]|uniref:ABC transporter substrate-binding protein n=1 Tax=Paenibacillus sp. J2TS4 TaxID=2807194 RepID=UPI001B12B186|nr:ABC transporter substrate-binding protein [Paenibacillus sp. J2TS4]GIP35048.1 sugar ABC transporter substrate-binding protein [Paenibacillus sp. J2TS4]